MKMNENALYLLLFVLCELHVIESAVIAVEFEEFLVIALFDDAPMLEN